MNTTAVTLNPLETPKPKKLTEQAKREAEVKVFTQHMRDWWQAFDPEHAAKILKDMGIKA